MRLPFRLGAILPSLLLFVAACGGDSAPPVDVFPAGDPIGTATHALIGPEGGTLATADGAFVVTVPKGALASAVELQVQEVTRTAPHGDARAFRLGPEGQSFLLPVTLTFALRDADLALPSPEALLAAYQDASGSWFAMRDATVDRVARTLSTETRHFSDWTYLEAFSLTPTRTTVAVGDPVELVVQSCLYEDIVDGDDYLAALVRTCRPFTLGALVKAASVDGVEGGTAATGTVSKSDATLTYVAPSALPARNPVAVSAEIALLGRRAPLLLVSDVTVTRTADALHGTATYDVGEGWTATAEVTWTAAQAHDGVVTYVPSGTVTATAPGCTLEPASMPIAETDGYLEIDSSYSPPIYYGGGTTSWSTTMTCDGGEPVAWTVVATWWSGSSTVTSTSTGTRLEGSAGWWRWSFSR